MEGISPEGMSTQAQQIWGMLDDMAENNPAAYRNFIQKQIADGKEHMAPPDPHMCIQVVLTSKPRGPLFINFCSWKRVPEPKSPQDAVPVTGTSISQENDEKGKYSLVSVAFNPKVLNEFGRDAKNQVDGDTLVQLALDYIEHEQNVKVTRTYTVLPKDKMHKGDLEFVRLSLMKRLRNQDQMFDQDVKNLEKQFGPLGDNERDSLMSKLSNLTVADNTKSNTGSGLNIGKTANGHQPIQITSTDKQPLKKGLIEEIGTSTSGNSVTKPYPTPKYSLEPCERNGCRCLELRVELPGVKSVAECELDISEDDVQLAVTDRFDLKVKLPSCINDDLAQARFKRNSSVLTLTMPVKT